MTLTAGSRVGQFEIAEAIGSGGMGKVFRARDRSLGRDVAIKVLPQQPLTVLVNWGQVIGHNQPP
jgi:serine/threonine protein kinase